MNEILIKIGSLYNILLIVFHLMFWRLFNWQEELRAISFLNSAVMQVLNISITLVFIIFCLISLVYTKELLQTSLGHSLLILISLFWLARAIQQVIFFKLKHWGSWAFTVFFLLGATLYGIPAISVHR
ncbi:MAG: hypothetical protein AMJ53_11690 [Gammaproteobacteria bacterium SG8_11]|nr:MAG: hypothetical protein AMJ53_11690 [Gammaproteobacteria bacterium SG8_11]